MSARCGPRGAIGDAIRAAAVPAVAPRYATRRELGVGGRAPPVGGALQRAGRGQRRGDVRRPAGHLPVGARGRRGLRCGHASAGRACTAPRRSPTAGGFGVEKPAMGVTVQLMVDAAVARRDVHLQPGERGPQHGRDQRQLGTGPGRRRRRGHARRLPRQQGHRRGRRQTIDDKAVEYVPAANGTERVDVDEVRRNAPCLDADALTTLVATAKRVEAALRRPPGHRVGVRPRRGRSCSSSSRARSPGLRKRRAVSRPRARIRHVHDLQQVRSRPADGAHRRRRPRDPPHHRRIGPRRAAASKPKASACMYVRARGGGGCTVRD